MDGAESVLRGFFKTFSEIMESLFNCFFLLRGPLPMLGSVNAGGSNIDGRDGVVGCLGATLSKNRELLGTCTGMGVGVVGVEDFSSFLKNIELCCG